MKPENSNTLYQPIPEVTTVKLRPGKSVDEIADLAADLVYGAVPNGEGTGLENVKNLSINSYPQDGSREHNLLYTYYRGYKDKKERMEFENTPPEIVKTWDKDKQQKWFTAQMNKSAKAVLPPLIGATALPWSIYGAVIAPGAIKAANTALNAYRWYRTTKRIANTIGTAYDIYDSSKTLLGKDGVSKTFNLFKEGNYLDGAKSLAGDVFLAWSPISYMKDRKIIKEGVRDFKIAFDRLRTPNYRGNKVYEVARPVLRTAVNAVPGARDVLSLPAYTLAVANQADEAGSVRKATKALFKMDPKYVFNTGVIRDEIIPTYRKYFFDGTVWEDVFPHGMSLSSNPNAKKWFDVQGGWPKHLDIYNMRLTKRRLRPIDVEINFSTNSKNPFTPTNYDGGDLIRFAYPEFNVGGHYEAIVPRTDLDRTLNNTKYNFLEAAMKDTQHYTPSIYGKKWNQRGLIHNLKVGTMDIIGRPFNLYGSGIYRYLPTTKSEFEVYLANPEYLDRIGIWPKQSFNLTKTL